MYKVSQIQNLELLIEVKRSKEDYAVLTETKMKGIGQKIFGNDVHVEWG